MPKSLTPTLLSLAACILMMACGPDEQHVRIKGHFDGIRQAEFYVCCEENHATRFDTVRINDGDFCYDAPLSAPAVFTLLYPNFSETVIVAEPGHTIKVSANANRLAETEVSGTKDNELLTDFRLQSLGRREDDTRLAAASFVRANASTMAAVAVFTKYFAQAQKLEPQPALSLLDVLKKAQPANASLLRLAARLRPLLQTGVGGRLPGFTATTIDGKTLNSQSLTGRPTLIVAWATWHGNSRFMLQTVRKLQRAYASKLNIVTVSLDANADDARRVVENDSLTGPAVCQEQLFESPLVRTLGLRYLPGTILTDAKGVIVARDVDAANLRTEVERVVH